MAWKNVIVLKGLAKKRDKVVEYIAERFELQMKSTRSAITSLPDGVRITSEGTWCISKGRIKVAEHDSDLVVSLIEESAPLSRTWLFACIGIWFLGILAIVVYFVYDSEKKQMLESFVQNAESAVHEAERAVR